MLVLQLIIVQVIIFGLVLFFIKKMLYGDTETAVDRLDKSYKKSEQKKQQLSELITEMEEEYKQKKVDAEKIAAEVKDKAEQEIMGKKEDILRKAKEESERIVADTQEASEKYRAQIKKEEEDNMYIKCAELLEATMKDTIRAEFEKVLIDDFLKEFDAIDVSHIPAGIEEVEVVFTANAGDEVKNKIKGLITNKLTTSVAVKETEDPNILGGVLVKFGSLVLDGSLASKIKDKLQQKVG